MFGTPVVASTTQKIATSPAAYVKDLCTTLQVVHSQARKSLHSAQARQKKDYDTKLYQRTYSVGDLVYKINSVTKVGLSRKLSPIWIGPLVIEEVLSSVLYRVQGRKRTEVIHHDRLKPCVDRILPLWLRQRRHIVLDLDETIAYSEEEQDPDEDIFGDLFSEDSGSNQNIRSRTGRTVRKPQHLTDFVLD